MHGIMTIELKGLRFHAFHGLFPEEKKTGNDFEINLMVSFVPNNTIIRDLDSTVDYARLYEILKTEMQKPRALLETLAMEIAELIHSLFPEIRRIDISIRKDQPPILHFTGNTGVRYQIEY
ncbi:MAG: dihydroneopterin aldolase [Chitinophagaceae bacterium]|nr:dihydroneopterin aldolase [Chitinophagaceae bacterium]